MTKTCKNCGIEENMHDRYWKNGDNFPCKKFEAEDEKFFKERGIILEKPQKHEAEDDKVPDKVVNDFIRKGLKKLEKPQKAEDFDLSDMRKRLKELLVKRNSIVNWDDLFDEIKYQDKTFIKKVEEDTKEMVQITLDLGNPEFAKGYKIGWDECLKAVLEIIRRRAGEELSK